MNEQSTIKEPAKEHSNTGVFFWACTDTEARTCSMCVCLPTLTVLDIIFKFTARRAQQRHWVKRWNLCVCMCVAQTGIYARTHTLYAPTSLDKSTKLYGGAYCMGVLMLMCTQDPVGTASPWNGRIDRRARYKNLCLVWLQAGQKACKSATKKWFQRSKKILHLLCWSAANTPPVCVCVPVSGRQALLHRPPQPPSLPPLPGVFVLLPTKAARDG